MRYSLIEYNNLYVYILHIDSNEYINIILCISYIVDKPINICVF